MKETKMSFDMGMDKEGVVLHTVEYYSYFKKEKRDFPGGPAVGTPCSQCRGPRFDRWSGN